MDKSKLKKISTWILFALFLFALSLVLVVNLFHINNAMNADLASDGILARLIWDTKEWIPTSWYRATETRIICTPNLTALYYGITHNMQLSVGLSCSTMTLLILYSVFYATGFSKSSIDRRILVLLAFLLLPSSVISLELLYLFASYYAIHTVILFFTLGTFTKIYEENAKLKPLEIILGFGFAFVFGLQGTRGILVIYGPIFAVSVLRTLYSKYSQAKFQKRDLIATLWCFVQLIFSFIGTLFPFSIGQDISRNIRQGFHKLVTIVIPDISRAIGFEYLNVPGKICILLLLAVVCFYFVKILIMLILKKNIAPTEWIFLVLCVSPILTALMVSFTTVESSERYYFVILFAMAWSILLIRPKQVPIILATLVCIFIIGCANIKAIYYPIIMHDNYKQSAHYQVARYLEDNGYKTAYATFDHANYITFLSNGKLGVYPIDSFEKMNICKWMTSTKWYPPNKPTKELTAYIVTESHKDELQRFIANHPNSMQMVAQIDGFTIYESPNNFTVLNE